MKLVYLLLPAVFLTGCAKHTAPTIDHHAKALHGLGYYRPGSTFLFRNSAHLRIIIGEKQQSGQMIIESNLTKSPYRRIQQVRVHPTKHGYTLKPTGKVIALFYPNWQALQTAKKPQAYTYWEDGETADITIAHITGKTYRVRLNNVDWRFEAQPQPAKLTAISDILAQQKRAHVSGYVD